MPRRLPPFAAIRAFEATARHLSMTVAADELCVTPSAVSHQIKTLEAFLDTALFERDGNRLRLTHTGASYQGKLTGLLDMLDATTREVASPVRQDLRVLATPGFAARWLVPRLDRLPFGRDIRLRVSEGAPSTDFASNEVDVVIHWGDAPVPGVIVEPFMTSTRYPVASPDFVARSGLRRPRDLLDVTLMHDAVGDGWAEWADAAGIGPLGGPRGPVFPHCEIATTGAEQGQGVALAYDAMVRETVASGRLVRLFDAVTLPRILYSVAYPEARASHPRIVAFRDWLFDEVARSGHLVEAPRTAAE